MSKSLDVSDLNIFYGAFKAVEGVSLTVEAKKITAFIGPSGCGKSTVLRTLNRMHELIPGARAEGKVLLDGQDIYDRASTRSRYAAISAWFSSDPTRSRRCPSTTTSSPV